MNKHQEAEQAYKNAIRLDPDNADYQNNLSVTQQRILEVTAASGVNVGAGAVPNIAGLPNMGGLDFAAAFNNPALMNLATQMFSNPSMQDTIQQLRSQLENMNNMNGILDV